MKSGEIWPCDGTTTTTSDCNHRLTARHPQKPRALEKLEDSAPDALAQNETGKFENQIRKLSLIMREPWEAGHAGHWLLALATGTAAATFGLMATIIVSGVLVLTLIVLLILGADQGRPPGAFTLVSYRLSQEGARAA